MWNVNEWLLWAAVMSGTVFVLGFMCGWIMHRRKIDRWNRDHFIN